MKKSLFVLVLAALVAGLAVSWDCIAPGQQPLPPLPTRCSGPLTGAQIDAIARNVQRRPDDDAAVGDCLNALDAPTLAKVADRFTVLAEGSPVCRRLQGVPGLRQLIHALVSREE